MVYIPVLAKRPELMMGCNIKSKNVILNLLQCALMIFHTPVALCWQS